MSPFALKYVLGSRDPYSLNGFPGFSCLHHRLMHIYTLGEHLYDGIIGMCRTRTGCGASLMDARGISSWHWSCNSTWALKYLDASCYGCQMSPSEPLTRHPRPSQRRPASRRALKNPLQLMQVCCCFACISNLEIHALSTCSK